MFSTGNFKNNIGEALDVTQPNPRDSEYEAVISATIKLGNDYSWAAMEDTPRKDASELTQLAPTGKYFMSSFKSQCTLVTQGFLPQDLFHSTSLATWSKVGHQMKRNSSRDLLLFCVLLFNQNGNIF